MSKSARERSNPPPRRKSCTVCIKARRRCEYGGGSACVRCASRDMICDHPTRRQHQSPPPSTTPQRVTSMLSVLAEDRAVLDATTAATPFYEGGLPAADLHTLLSPSSLEMGGPWTAEADKGAFSFGGLDGFDMPADLNSTAMDGLYGLEPLSAPYSSSILDEDGSTPSTTEDHSVPEINFLRHAPGTVLAPAAQQLGQLSTELQERLNFAVELIRTAPRTMVERLETPWSHRLLYKDGTPPAMRHALGACALYLAKNAVNAPVVFSLIDAHVGTLLAAPPPTTLRLALAHAHALILYQVMGLFDGDIAARGRGERLIPALEAATMQLLAHVRFDSELLRVTDLAAYPVQPARDLWHDWRLHESARRTVLITFYMLQAYRAMASPAQAGARCSALRHSWTLSRGLWQADSPAEFARVWREGRWFVITNGRFEEALRAARADDVDAFGRMWFTALMGIEEAEGWFAAKGGSLRETEPAPVPAMVC